MWPSATWPNTELMAARARLARLRVGTTTRVRIIGRSRIQRTPEGNPTGDELYAHGPGDAAAAALVRHHRRRLPAVGQDVLRVRRRNHLPDEREPGASPPRRHQRPDRPREPAVLALRHRPLAAAGAAGVLRLGRAA